MSKLPVISISVDASTRTGRHWWYVAIHRGIEQEGVMQERSVSAKIHPSLSKATVARLRRAQERLMEGNHE